MRAEAWFLSQFAIPLVILRIGTPPSFKVWTDHSVRIRESWWFVSPSRRTYETTPSPFRSRDAGFFR